MIGRLISAATVKNQFQWSFGFENFFNKCFYSLTVEYRILKYISQRLSILELIILLIDFKVLEHSCMLEHYLCNTVQYAFQKLESLVVNKFLYKM